jgi:hypothetical protein
MHFVTAGARTEGVDEGHIRLEQQVPWTQEWSWIEGKYLVARDASPVTRQAIYKSMYLRDRCNSVVCEMAKHVCILDTLHEGYSWA